VHNTVVSEKDWSSLMTGAFMGLESLELSDVDARKERYGRILDGLPHATKLACRACFADSLEAILERPALVRQLEHLDMAGPVRMTDGIRSHLGDADIDALISAVELTKLRVLDLRNNRFSAVAKARLRAAPQFAKTQILID
jgi:hypothetical protein